MATWMASDNTRVVIGVALILAFGIPLSISDIKHRRLPNRLVALFTAAVIVWLGLLSVSDKQAAWSASRWAVLIGIPAILISFIAPRALGMGDAKLIPALTAVVAATSLQPAVGMLAVFWVASASGLAVACWQRYRHQRWPSSIAYGPHLLAASLLGCVLHL